MSFVIVCNLLIALVNLYIAWRVWKLREFFAQAANILDNAAQGTHNVLSAAPELVYNGQRGSRSLRQQYQKLVFQLQRVQQVLRLLSQAQTIWRVGKRATAEQQSNPGWRVRG